MLFRFDPFEPFERAERRSASLLAMDAVRSDDAVFVYFDVPGVDPEDVDITVERNAITVETSRRWRDPELQTLSSERAQGTFRRQIQVSDNLDLDSLEASLDRGVLTLEIPLREDTKPRSIEVQSTSRPRQVEAAGTGG